MPDYRFRPGFRARAVTAGAAAGALEALHAAGPLTASAVFEAAKPKGAVLHGEFEWDGQTAIRELGLMRAREIIRAVIVVPTAASAPARHVYVHVESEAAGLSRGGRYELLETVVGRPDLYEQALTALQRKFDAASQALDELRAAAEGTSAPDRLAAIGLAVQGFGAVREALAILR